MTMMVDSGLANSLTPATPGVSAAAGAAAPTGMAALFAALMGGVANTATAASANGTASLDAAATGDAMLSSGTDQPEGLGTTPLANGETPPLTSEIATYLDQLSQAIEPKKIDRAVTAHVTTPSATEKTDMPTDAVEAESIDPDAATPVQTALDTASAPVAQPPAPIVAPFVPLETLHSTPLPAKPRQSDAGSPSLASVRTGTAPVPAMPDGEAPSPPTDLTAAVEAFLQQHKNGTPTAKPTRNAPMSPEAATTAAPSVAAKSEISTKDGAPSAPLVAVALSPASSVGTATPTFAMPTPAVAPSIGDVGAMLGQQVIDMGSDGQWIDGLAREIAALGKGEGQGSFRLSPEHLGPMRVDIRTGDQGTNVTLTVETKAAEAMLVQDRHLLKADAQLSALRIGDVTVERVAHVAEVARSDSATGQGTSGQNGGQGQSAQNAALAQSQSQNQGNSQNNGQSAANRKVPDAAAVSSEAEPRAPGDIISSDGARRARYA